MFYYRYRQYRQILWGVVFLVASMPFSKIYALASIESVVLGDFSENYSENMSDPLNYIFVRDNSISHLNTSYKRELAYYRGFYEEGKNLINFCKNKHEINYVTEWQKVQVLRSLLSEIQYVGLDIMSRAIPKYAKALEFNREEYGNLVDGLVGNFCSNNLSVISKRELRNNLLIKYDKENNFKLPSVSGNPYFPNELNSYLSSKTGLENEFKFTVKLFQSVCSWGGDPMNPGLMVPILKNSVLMSFFFRQMDNQAIEWNELDNALFLKEDRNTVQVWCEHLICRKISRGEFYNKIYYSIGGSKFSEDLKRLYCRDLSRVTYQPHETDAKIAKIMDSIKLEEENFINAQFVALLTGVPDFLLRSDKYTRSENVFRSSIDSRWSKWAKSQVEKFNRELYYEEPLSVELVDRELYFQPSRSKIKLSFDVNLGEFDRINQRIGKVRVKFTLNVQRSFLHYCRDLLKNFDPKDVTLKERIVKKLKIHIAKDVNLAREKFIIPPWKGDLESLMVNEIIEQLSLFSDKNFKMDTKGFEPIIVELNYGVFALKYINHQKTVKDNREKFKINDSKTATSKDIND